MDNSTQLESERTEGKSTSGPVRWLFRPDRFLERLLPAQLLAAIDAHTPATK
jgi:hypothetical protein